MSLFDDDPFDDIVKQFFGGNNSTKRNYRRGPEESEDESRTIDFIDAGEYIYVLFEISGYGEEDIKIKLEGKILGVTASKKEFEGVKEYLIQRLANGISYQKDLSEAINTKEFDYTVKNGVLEVKFKNKK